MLGRRRPSTGRARAQAARRSATSSKAEPTGSSRNRCLTQLNRFGAATETSAQLLVAHQFPLALGQRPLRSLSPGERARAALICLFSRAPAVELLILDEPTFSLDLLAQRALAEGTVRVAWRARGREPRSRIFSRNRRRPDDSAGLKVRLFGKQLGSLPRVGWVAWMAMKRRASLARCDCPNPSHGLHAQLRRRYADAEWPTRSVPVPLSRRRRRSKRSRGVAVIKSNSF